MACIPSCASGPWQTTTLRPLPCTAALRKDSTAEVVNPLQLKKYSSRRLHSLARGSRLSGSSLQNLQECSHAAQMTEQEAFWRS
jgi:hypothetical protein